MKPCWKQACLYHHQFFFIGIGLQWVVSFRNDLDSFGFTQVQNRFGLAFKKQNVSGQDFSIAMGKGIFLVAPENCPDL